MNKDKILDYARDAFIDTINFLKMEATIENLDCQTIDETGKVNILFKGKITNPPLDEPYATFSWTVLATPEPEKIMLAVRRRMTSVIAIQVMREAPFIYAAIEAFRYNDMQPLAGMGLLELDEVIVQNIAAGKDVPTAKRLFETLVSAMRTAILDPLDGMRRARIAASRELKN